MGKKRKNFYCNNSNRKHFKSDYVCGNLDIGTKGVIITHERGKENKCRNDAFALFNYFADQWFGEYSVEILPTEINDKAPSCEQTQSYMENDCKTLSVVDNIESDDEADINAALSEEVENIKKAILPKNKQNLRFYALKSGCNNIVFIKFNDKSLKPSIFIQRVIETIESVRDTIPHARNVLRMHPADVTCKAHLIDIKNTAEEYLPTAFANVLTEANSKDSSRANMQFNIVYRGRNNEHLRMHDVIDAISSAAQDACPLWRYNCRSDTIYLLVDVIKTVCAMGIVENYAKFKKFNVRELFLADQNTNSSNGLISKSNIPVEELSANENTTSVIS